MLTGLLAVFDLLDGSFNAAINLWQKATLIWPHANTPWLGLMMLCLVAALSILGIRDLKKTLKAEAEQSRKHLSEIEGVRKSAYTEVMTEISQLTQEIQSFRKYHILQADIIEIKQILDGGDPNELVTGAKEKIRTHEADTIPMSFFQISDRICSLRGEYEQLLKKAGSDFLLAPRRTTPVYSPMADKAPVDRIYADERIAEWNADLAAMISARGALNRLIYEMRNDQAQITKKYFPKRGELYDR